MRGLVPLVRPAMPSRQLRKPNGHSVSVPIFPIEISDDVIVHQTDVTWSEYVSRKDKLRVLQTHFGAVSEWVVNEQLDIVYSISPFDGNNVMPGDVVSFACVGKKLHSAKVSPKDWFSMIASQIGGKPFLGISRKDVVQVGNRQVQLMRVQGCACGWALHVTELRRNSASLDVCGCTAGQVASINEKLSDKTSVVSCRGRKYQVRRISLIPASQQQVDINGHLMTVADYFKSKNISLACPDSGFLAVDSCGRFLPLEMCTSVLSEQPVEEMQDLDFFESLKRFGLTVDFMKQVHVSSRPLELPSSKSPPQLSSQVRPPDIHCGVIAFCDEQLVGGIIGDLRGRCKELTGVNLQFPVIPVSVREHMWESQFRAALKTEAFLKHSLDLIIILFDDKLPSDVYSSMKLVLETKLGIASQAISVNRFQNSQNVQGYWNSLLSQLIEKTLPKMALHQPVGKAAPSTYVVGIWSETIQGTQNAIIGVCMSLDHQLGSFLQKVLVVERKKLTNVDLTDVFYEHLLKSFEINVNFPNRIICYRRSIGDGSDSFMAVASELKGWDAAIGRINRESKTKINPKLISNNANLNPHITIIHCEHRTNIRLDESAPPSVIEDGIVEPKGLNFYLHVPKTQLTHYKVFHDQNNFTMNEIANFSSHICFDGSRSPSALSHARKLAKRSKMYLISEWSQVNELRRAGPSDVAEYLNQKLFSAISTIDRLNCDGRSVYI